MRTVLWRTLVHGVCALGVTACDSTTSDSPQAVPWATWIADGSVGDSLGNTPGTLGYVGRTALTQRSEILVLDAAAKTIVAFDTVGRVLGAGAGPGDGPGEFRDPVSLSVFTGDSVAVVDRGLRRIQFFAPLRDGLHPVRSVSLTFWPNAACIINDALYLLGNDQGKYLHRISLLDSSVQSFAPVQIQDDAAPPSFDVTSRRFELGGGTLICAPEEEILVHLPEYFGQAFGISASGQLLWTFALDSFVPPVRVRVAAGTRLDLDERFGFANRVESGAALGLGTAQIVVRRSYAREAGREPEFLAFVLALANGNLRSRSLAPPLFGAVNAAMALEHIQDPFPAVRIWRKKGR